MGKDISILVIGPKNWPSKGSDILHEKMGGIDKYVFNLYTKLSERSSIRKIYVISRKFSKQKSHELFSEKIEVFRVPFFDGHLLSIPSYNLFASFISFKILTTETIDVIHAHSPISIYVGCLLGTIFFKPVVGTPHGILKDVLKIENRRSFYFLMEVLDRFCYPRLANLIFLGHNEKSAMKNKFKGQSIKTCIVPSGINPPSDREIAGWKKKDDKFTIIFVGRLKPIKGVEKLVEAISLLPKNIKGNIRCKILGDGYLKENLKNAIEKKNLQSIVHLEGFRENIWEHLYPADLFILPSVSEGFPVSLMEAMYAGLPCVVNRWGLELPNGSVHVLSNHRTETIARTIERLYYDEELRKRLGEKARDVARERFRFERVINEHAGLYESVVVGE